MQNSWGVWVLKMMTKVSAVGESAKNAPVALHASEVHFLGCLDSIFFCCVLCISYSHLSNG